MSFSCHVVLCNLGWCRVTSLLSFSWGAAFLFSVTSDSWAIWDDTLLTASVKTLSSLFRHISSFDTIGNFNSSDIVWGLAISKWLFMSLCKVPMMAIWTKSCSKISICLALSWRPMTKRLNDSSWRCFAADSSAFNMCFCCSVGAKRNFSAEITLSKVSDWLRNEILLSLHQSVVKIIQIIFRHHVFSRYHHSIVWHRKWNLTGTNCRQTYRSSTWKHWVVYKFSPWWRLKYILS